MSASPNSYKLLKTSTGLTDDADYAGTQVEPDDTATFCEPHRTGDTIKRGCQLELCLEWLTSGGVVVVGAGSYDIQAVKVVGRGWLDDSSSVVAGSVTVAGCDGSQPVFFPDLKPGDVFGVRVTNVTAPATAAKYRVLYREVQA